MFGRIPSKLICFVGLLTYQEFHIQAPQGDLSLCPATRSIAVSFRGFTPPKEIELLVGGQRLDCRQFMSFSKNCFKLRNILISPTQDILIRIQLEEHEADYLQKIIRENNFKQFKQMLRLSPTVNEFKDLTWQLFQQPLHQILKTDSPMEHEMQTRALVEILTGCGIEHIIQNGTTNIICVWNPNQLEDAKFRVIETVDGVSKEEEFQMIPKSKIWSRPSWWNGYLRIEVQFGRLWSTAEEIGKQAPPPKRTESKLKFFKKFFN